MTEHISRDRAKELIDDAEGGSVTIVSADEVPVIGDVPEDERRVEYELDQYTFGEFWEDEDEDENAEA